MERLMELISKILVIQVLGMLNRGLVRTNRTVRKMGTTKKIVRRMVAQVGRSSINLGGRRKSAKMVRIMARYAQAMIPRRQRIPFAGELRFADLFVCINAFAFMLGAIFTPFARWQCGVCGPSAIGSRLGRGRTSPNKTQLGLEPRREGQRFYGIQRSKGRRRKEGLPR